jgi:Tfp pilus assembly protein PilN
MVVVLPVLVIVVLGLAFAYMEFIIKDLQKESDELKQYLSSQEVAKIRKDYNDRKKISDSMKNYGTMLDTIDKNLSSLNTISSSLIEKINGVLPKDTVFKSYTITGKIIRIAGETGSRISSAELLHNLDGTGIFEDIRIGSLAQAVPGTPTAFTLEGTLKEVSGK